MLTDKLTKTDVTELIYGGGPEDWEVVENKIASTSRWSAHKSLVIKHKPSGKYYATGYSEGLTEIQDEQPFDYSEPKFEEVVPKNKLVVEYVRPVDHSTKEREIVNISSLDYYSIEEFDPNYTCIEEKQVYFDSEKGFVDYEYIFQRKSDNKYFKLEYTDYGRGEDNLGDNNLKEVFLVDLKIKKVFK